jgi:hypothetical protein
MQHSSGIGSVITTKVRITYRASKLQSIKVVHQQGVLYIKRYRRNYSLGSLHKIEPQQGKIFILQTMFYKLLDVKWYHLNGLFRFY